MVPSRIVSTILLALCICGTDAINEENTETSVPTNIPKECILNKTAADWKKEETKDTPVTNNLSTECLLNNTAVDWKNEETPEISVASSKRLPILKFDAMAICDKALSFVQQFKNLPLPDELRDAQSCFSAAGDFVISLVTGKTDKKTTLDDIKTQLEALSGQVKEIGEKIGKKIDAIQLTMVKLSFITTFVENVRELRRLMIAAIEEPGNTTVNQFRDKCSNNNPHNFLQILADKLTTDETNVFYHEMENDPLKSKATVNRMRSTIAALILESVTIGNFYDRITEAADLSKRHQEQRKTNSMKVAILLEKQIMKYSVSYWPDAVQKAFEQTVDAHKGVDDPLTVADELKEKLNEINTNDRFVYNVLLNTTFVDFVGKNAFVHDHNGYRLLIHRCRQWDKFPESNRQHVNSAVTFHSTKYFSRNIEGYNKEALNIMLDYYAQYGVGFIALVDVMETNFEDYNQYTKENNWSGSITNRVHRTRKVLAHISSVLLSNLVVGFI